MPGNDNWISQGRQEHGWFGNGTSAQQDYAPVSAAGAAEAGARVFAVTEFAADALQAAKQPGPAIGADTVRAARPALREMLPVWAGGVGFDTNSFRKAFFGEAAHPVDAYLMQRVTLAVMNGHDYAGLKRAGQELADAVAGIGAQRFSDVLAQARAQLVPVQADRAPGGGAAGATVTKVAAADAVALPGVAAPAVGTVLRGAAAMLGSGAAAVAGAAAIMLWPKSLIEHAPGPEDMPRLNRDASEPAAADTVLEARKPKPSGTSKPAAPARSSSGSSGEAQPPTGDQDDDDNMPPAGDLKEASKEDLEKAASAEGYRVVEPWKRDHLGIRSDSQILKDKRGNLYAIPRKGSGPPQRLYERIPK